MMEERRSIDNKETAANPGIIQEKISQANGEIKIKKYAKGKILGRGGFAKCYEVTSLETNKVMAAKIIAKSSLNRARAKQKLITEVKIHKSLNDNHVVKFEHVFEDHENVYILLEICTNQTLNELIKRRKRLTQMEAQYYMAQIVSALKYLHQNKVIHRDLKLGNLFLSQNIEIKLGDFGLATRLQYDGEKKKTVCGTPNYIAPQILENKGHSYEIDIWSLGVILYTQLVGKPPFETPEVKETYKKIRLCQYSFPDHVTISEQARNLIQKILVLDPSKRPTLDQIMADPFMTFKPVPKTLPRSALACPPPCQHRNKVKGNENQSQTRVSSQIRDTEAEKKISKNGSQQRDQRLGLNSNAKLLQKEEFPSSSANIQPPKEIKAQQPQHIPKNLGTNLNTYSGTFRQIESMNQQGTNFSHQQVYVKKWVDYSSKYGLGYLLSDGSTGVYFNDSTKIILDRNNKIFEYYEKRPGERLETLSRYTMDDHPQQRELRKKVTLLQHFTNYLYADVRRQDLHGNRNPDFVYVKKWMKTKHAIMFRLSNKIVHVIFTDKTQIILSSEQKLATYTNLQGKINKYPLATALDEKDAEMAKRLRYTKEILTHMLSGAPAPSTSQGPSKDTLSNNT